MSSEQNSTAGACVFATAIFANLDTEAAAQNCVNTHLFCSLRLVFERDADLCEFSIHSENSLRQVRCRYDKKER